MTLWRRTAERGILQALSGGERSGSTHRFVGAAPLLLLVLLLLGCALRTPCLDCCLSLCEMRGLEVEAIGWTGTDEFSCLCRLPEGST